MKFKAKDAVKVFNGIKTKISQRVKIGSKRHSDAFIKHFQEKLINGDFTPRLKKSTVKTKRQKTYDLPETPLYARGARVKASMYNGLKAKPIKSGWRVAPEGQHGKISMQKLFAIHEKGAKLKNGGNIPARKPIARTVKSYKAGSEYGKINHQIFKKLI